MTTPLLLRETLTRHGPEHLGTAELIAIILGTGHREANALEVAQQLLKDKGGLTGLARAHVVALAESPGIGVAKAARLVAAMALQQRTDATSTPPLIDAPLAVWQHFAKRVGALSNEHLWVLGVDSRNRLLFEREISRGGLDYVSLTPRDVFHDVLTRRAAACVLVHNHPSGDPTPSEADRALTARLVAAGELIGVPILDHVVIATGGFLSIRDGASQIGDG